MKLLLYGTKTISPEYCRPKDKEAKRKEHVCTKKIKVFWKKKRGYIYKNRREFILSLKQCGSIGYLHGFFCMKMLSRMFLYVML